MKEFRSYGNSTRTDEKKVGKFYRFGLPILFGVMLIIFCCVAGVNIGCPELIETLNDGSYVDWSDSMNVAEAGGDGGTTSAYAATADRTTTMGNNVTQQFTYSANAGSSYVWRYYYEGNDPGHEQSTGNGWVHIGGKNLKQKKVVHSIGIFIKLTNTLEKLAAGGSLQLTQMHIQMKSDNKWDQSVYCGFTLGLAPGVGYGSCFNDGWQDNAAGGTRIGSTSFDKSGQTSEANWSGAATIPSGEGAKYIFIWIIGRTNWTTFVGGEYPSLAMQNINYTFKSTDGAKPEINLGSVGTWKQQKYVTVNIKDPGSNHQLSNVSFSYPTEKGTQTTYKDEGVKSSSTGHSYTVGSTTDTALQLTGELKVSATDWAGNTANATFSANTLYIDRYEPTISNVRFRPKSEIDGKTYTNSANLNTGFYTGEVTLIMTVVDTDAAGTKQSGVNSVTVKNTVTGEEKTAVNISGTNYYKVDNVGNGSYTITAKDNVGWTKTATTSMWGIDTIAPTVTVKLSKLTSPSLYSNGAITAEFTVTDRAQITSYSALYANATYQQYRKDITISNKNYKHSFSISYSSSGRSASIPATLKSSTYSTSTGEYKQVYEAILPYYGMEAYTFVATDNAGLSTNVATTVSYADNSSATLSNQGSLSAYIDTICPRVTDFTLDGMKRTGSYKTKWLRKDALELSLEVDDRPTGLTDIVSLNTGSGIKSVSIVARDHNGNRVEKYCQTQTYSDGVNNVTAKFTLIANYDEVKRYEFVIVDGAGNTNVMSGSSLELSDGSVINSYVVRMGGTRYEEVEVFKDYNPVTVEIFTDQACTQKLTGADEYYMMPWSNAEKTELYIRMTFGPSGGELSIKRGDGADWQFADNDNAIVYSYANPVSDVNMKTDGTGYGLAQNVRVYKFSPWLDGLVSYTPSFKNGAEFTVNGGTVITRMDRTGPTQTLFGFGSDHDLHISGLTGVEQIIRDSSNGDKPIKDFVSESDLYDTQDFWYSNLLYAFVTVNDVTGSGTDRASQYYGFAGKYNPLSSAADEATAAVAQMQSSGQVQTSKAKAKITLSHNGYSYTYEVSNGSVMYYTKVGSDYVLAAELWNLKTIALAKDALGHTIYDEENGYDILKGKNEPIVYRIEVSDFIGNVTMVTSSKGSDKENLKYKVDPFTLSGSVQSIIVGEGDKARDYAYTKEDGEWTKDVVTVNFKIKEMGLSQTFVEYGMLPVVDTPDAKGEGAKTNWPDSGMTLGQAGTGSSQDVAIVFSNVQSRCIQLFIRIKNASNGVKPTANTYGGNYMFIRQDVDKPTPVGLFFSTNPDIGSKKLTVKDGEDDIDVTVPNPDTAAGLNDDIVVYYEIARLNGDTAYSFIRRTSDKSANIWIDAKVYMYIVVSDCVGNGMGSGIQKVMSSCKSSPKVEETWTSYVYLETDSGSGYKTLYRSATAEYGYDKATDQYGFDFSFYDNQNNYVTISGAEKDTNGHKLMPIVDKVIPAINLYSANYVDAQGNLQSYIKKDASADKEDESDDEEEKYDYKLKQFAGSDGTPVMSDINVQFKYIVGISDAKVYIRLRKWGEVLSANDELRTKNSDNEKGIKGYVKNLTTLDLSQWTAIDASKKTQDGETGAAGLLWGYTISADKATVKNGYDVLIISNSGLFFYFDAGQVFIDTEPPTIDRDASFLALASSTAHMNTNDKGEYVVNYEELKILGDDEFTNDAVYAYFKVEDLGSGVKRVYNAMGDQEDLTNVTLVRDGVECGNYYRLKIESGSQHHIIAVDEAGNEAESWEFTPNIDTTPPTLTISAVTASGETYKSGKFTNEDSVTITLNVNFGSSGFGGVEYTTDGWKTKNWVDKASLLKSSDDWTVDEANKKAEVTFTLTTEQKTDYEFVAYNNVKKANALDGKEPKSEKAISVYIDTTKPSIDLDNANSNFRELESVWHAVGKELVIYAYDKHGELDPNLKDDEKKIASEIATVTIDYQLADGYAPQAIMLMGSDKTYRSKTASGDKFTLDYYVVYTITVTDEAGNSTTQDILPRVDSVKPSFGFTDGEQVRSWSALSIEENDFSLYKRYNGEWINTNVQSLIDAVYSISGAYLMYSEKDLSKTNGNFGGWYNWSEDVFEWLNPQVGEGGTTKTQGYSMKFGVEKEDSRNKAYKIKLVSEAGLESDELLIGNIRIDKIKPVFEVEVKRDGGANDYGTANGNTTTVADNEWTSGAVKITVTLKSSLPSGYTLYYNVDQKDGENWQGLTKDSVISGNFSFDYANKQRLEHTINSSVNGTNYKYRFVSNSGMESDIYYVNGVKIDWYAASLSINAETSYKTGTAQGDGKLNVVDPKDYLGLDDYSWNLTGDSVQWTNKDAVIIKVSVSEIGYSGVTLQINGKDYETVPHDENGSNSFVRYYAVTSTADLDVKVVSGAGKAKQTPVKVRIDNDIPVIMVSSIDGRKSTNWNEEDVDSCWYVSSTPEDLNVGVVIRFAIGKLVDGQFVACYNDDGAEINSGYEIQYTISTKSVPDESDWITNNTSRLLNITGTTVTSEQYRFRIKSGSGMVYMLGDAAYNSVGTLVKTQNEMATLIGAQNGIIKHLSDTDFVYFLNVDSHTYKIENADVTQTIKVYVNDAYADVTGTDFADYTFERFVDGNYVKMSAPYTFKHGDLIRVKYNANEYIHRYTEYGTMKDGQWVNVNVFDEGDDDELHGEFEFRIATDDIVINAYFMKELEVVFGGTVKYLQNGNQPDVTAIATYTYTNKDGVTEKVNIPLGVAYTDMDGNAVDGQFELGGYIVKASVEAANADSFRLNNPTTVLLVKYFNENAKPTSEENPYIIKSQADLDFISSEVSDGFIVDEDGNYRLTEPRSYLDAHFVVDGNLVLNSDFNGIEGDFKGTFDGAGYVITIAGGDKEGSFGFFQKLSGKVDDVVIELEDTISVYNAEDVGILAAVIDGGTVGAARVNGYIDIVSANAGANIGGLAGKTVGANIGDGNKPVYVNVVISNHGNVVRKANVGGLIGLVGANTTVQKTYTYSHLTLYNVSDDVKVGAVFGNAENISDSHFVSNRYFADNVFVNDELKSGFSGIVTDVNDASETRDTIKGVDYELLIATRGDGAIGGVEIVGQKIRNLVIDKLYRDFGMEKDEEYGLGTGSAADPLRIESSREMRAIDEYMNLNYSLNGDVDMIDFGESIGLHKIFAGSFDAKGNKITNFGVGFTISDGDRVGLFAALSGTVKNVVMTGVNVDIEGSENAKYVGVIAGKLLGGVVGNAVAIGTVKVEKNGLTDVSYAGAVAGYAEGGAVYDVFSIVNIKLAAQSVTVGGILGYANGTRLSKFVTDDSTELSGAVFGLGRVESEATNSIVGAIFADGNIAADSGAVYAIKENAYSNKLVVTSSGSNVVKLVAFDDSTMRGTAFSNGDAIFEKVFKTDGLYYLRGSGTDADKFVVGSGEDFSHIEHMLYASYNISEDITFENFKTIGVGLKFTGSIDGKNADSISAEDGTVSSLMNVTDALVYNNAGRIADLGINVYYDKTVGKDGVTFGAVAIINSTGGTIRNVTVSGNIAINSVEKNSTVIVSGFVGIAEGGVIEGDNKVQNSISGLNIKVDNAATVYAGGYVGKMDGSMTLSYGIGNGTLDITNCGNVFAGTLVGAAYKDYEWTSLEETEDYRYVVTVDGEETDKLFGYEALR